MDNLDLRGIFAQNLKRYMEELDIKQKDIMTVAGVSRSAVSQWTRGEKMPRMDKIEILANYFGVQRSDLIEEKTPLERTRSAGKKKLINAVDELSEDDIRKLQEYAEALLLARRADPE